MICHTCTSIWRVLGAYPAPRCGQCGGIRTVSNPEVVLGMSTDQGDAIKDGKGVFPGLLPHSLFILMPKDGDWTVVQAGRERYRFKNVEYIRTTTDWKSRYA